MSKCFEGLQSVASQTDDLAQSFVADEWVGTHATGVVLLAEVLIRQLSAIQVLATRRVEETGGFRGSGQKDAASWFADVTGRTRTEAAGLLATGRRLSEQPRVDDAATRAPARPTRSIV